MSQVQKSCTLQGDADEIGHFRSEATDVAQVVVLPSTPKAWDLNSK